MSQVCYTNDLIESSSVVFPSQSAVYGPLPSSSPDLVIKNEDPYVPSVVSEFPGGRSKKKVTSMLLTYMFESSSVLIRGLLLVRHT